MRDYIPEKESGRSRASSIAYERELNPAQLKAVTTINGPQLVIAGAGSGKTRTLVYRVAYLVEYGVDPESILLLTFTRKAAQEMMIRASQILDDRCGRVSGGTFHSFANSILRKYAGILGYSTTFSIVDRSDAEDIIGMLRTDLELHKKERRFPKKSTLLNIISKMINTGKSCRDVLNRHYPQFLPDEQEILQLWEEYSRYKFSRSIMDYDDLLLNLRDLLFQYEDVRKRLSQRYPFIMVDEYQDTNRLQGEIAFLLASEHGNIMVVGDDSQSIYSFRGANFKNIIDFPDLYPDCTITTMEENYRSSQPILSLTNAIIENASRKFSKVLFTEIAGGGKPYYGRLRSEDHQAWFVCERIKELQGSGISLREMAVLFRSGWHSNELEFELAGNGIPFNKYGGIKFVEAAHVKDVIAFLRVVFNRLDAVAWCRVLPLMPGIGQATARRLVRQISDENGSLQALLHAKRLRSSSKEALTELYEFLEHLSRDLVRPGEQIQQVLGFYLPLMETKYDDFEKRKNDLGSLVQIAGRYHSLERFLSDLTLEPPDYGQIASNMEEAGEERLVLSTIHSAKGLEWRVVFLIHLVDGCMPSWYSINDEESLEEERRLFYVAATRAKEMLYLLAPKIQGRHLFASINSSPPSRFLFEIKNFGRLTQKILF